MLLYYFSLVLCSTSKAAERSKGVSQNEVHKSVLKTRYSQNQALLCKEFRMGLNDSIISIQLPVLKVNDQKMIWFSSALDLTIDEKCL